MDLYDNDFLLSMLIQFITIVPYGIAFWREKKKNVLQWVAFSCGLFTVGYLISKAYSGIVIAVGTFISTLIGMFFERVNNIKLYVRHIVFFLMVLLTILVSLSIDNSAKMWLILIAGFFDYYAYLVFKEYGKTMHIVLIASQITLVVYELLYSLFVFALLDFVTAIIITVHLFRLIKAEQTVKQKVCK